MASFLRSNFGFEVWTYAKVCLFWSLWQVNSRLACHWKPQDASRDEYVRCSARGLYIWKHSIPAATGSQRAFLESFARLLDACLRCWKRPKKGPNLCHRMFCSNVSHSQLRPFSRLLPSEACPDCVLDFYLYSMCIPLPLEFYYWMLCKEKPLSIDRTAHPTLFHPICLYQHWYCCKGGNSLNPIEGFGKYDDSGD